jgi:hypothetical protein
MLALKFAALAFGAGTLITMLSPDSGSDLLLAIIAWLSYCQIRGMRRSAGPLCPARR